jgi:N-acylglucosamine 2-epimerase
VAEASTGDRVWEEWFATIHEYAFARFPDRVNGEWFGYLRRTGVSRTRSRETLQGLLPHSALHAHGAGIIG